MITKEIKKQLRELKKIKNACKVGSAERKELNIKIKDLKKQLEATQIVDKDKEVIINAIKKLDNTFDKLGIDLNKFTKEELQKHLNKRRKE